MVALETRRAWTWNTYSAEHDPQYHKREAKRLSERHVREASVRSERQRGEARSSSSRFSS